MSTDKADLIDALDVIEDLVGQHFIHYDDDGPEYGHAFMGANEDAAGFLVRMRPTKWELTPTGIRRVGADT